MVVLKCGPRTSCSGNTWKLIRNENSYTSSHLLSPKHWAISAARSPLGDAGAGSSLRIHSLMSSSLAVGRSAGQGGTCGGYCQKPREGLLEHKFGWFHWKRKKENHETFQGRNNRT